MNESGSGVAMPPMSPIGSPDIGEFERAFALFIKAVASAAIRRGEKGDVHRLGLLADTAASRCIEMLNTADVHDSLGQQFSSEDDLTGLAVLAEEMVYFAWRYRAAEDSQLNGVEGVEEQWGSGQGDIMSDALVDDTETIVGSVEKLLDKLPRPLKNLVHILLEALKLTRGVI